MNRSLAALAAALLGLVVLCRTLIREATAGGGVRFASNGPGEPGATTVRPAFRRLRVAAGLLAGGALCAVTMLGCGDASPPPSGARSTSSATVASALPAPTDVAGGHASPPASTSGVPATGSSVTPAASGGPPGLAGMLACTGTDVAFPIAVLDEPPLAELGPNAPASALRAFLGTETATELGLPEHGWRTAITSAASVTFVAPRNESWAFATITPAAGADWQFWEGGHCDLAVRLPASVGYATWHLDPAHQPDPSATSLSLLARETACAGGQAPGARMLAPIVMETDALATITLVVRRVPGGADCQANPEVPVTVALSQPIGTRTLLDGSSFPAVPRS